VLELRDVADGSLANWSMAPASIFLPVMLSTTSPLWTSPARTTARNSGSSPEAGPVLDPGVS
jgi:hypothetical protein